MTFCRAPQYLPAKEGVVKLVRVIFHLVLKLLPPTGGEAT